MATSSVMPHATHTGWFWFCPVYLALKGDECDVEARYAWLEWLFTVAEYFEHARIYLSSMMGIEPAFMFRNVRPIQGEQAHG